MPQKYIINSTYEFLQIAKTRKNAKMMASLDVESLFSNVPVGETIDIILSYVYNCKMKKPVIPQEVLRELLVICTTETSFRNHDARLFVQIDGVSMGASLGPVFANYYMAHIENQLIPSFSIFHDVTYCR